MLSGEDEVDPPLSDDDLKGKKTKKNRKNKKTGLSASTEGHAGPGRVTQLETMLKQPAQSLVPPAVAPRLPKVVLLVLLSGTVTCIDAIIVIPPLFRDVESKFAFSLAFAAYYLGQIVSAPLLGYWSDEDHINRTLVFSAVCGLGGNIMFAFSSRNPLMMCLSRFTVGLGTANILVPWAHIRALSSKKQRDERFALYGWCINFGQILGAGLGLLGQFVPDPFHYYLIPGLLMAGIFGVSLVLHSLNWFLVRRQGGLAVDPEDFDQALESIRIPPTNQRCFVTQKLCVLLLLFGVMSFSYWSFVAAILPVRSSPSTILWSEFDIYVWLLIVGFAAAFAHGILQLTSVGPAKILSTALPILGIGLLILFRISSEIMDWQIYIAAIFVSGGYSWLTPLAPRIIDSDSNERIGLRTSWFFIGISFCSIGGILSAQWLVELDGLSLVGLLDSCLLLLAMTAMIINPDTKSQGKTITSLNQPLLDQAQFSFQAV